MVDTTEFFTGFGYELSICSCQDKKAKYYQHVCPFQMLVRPCLVNSVWAFSHWRDVLHLELAALQQAYRKRGHG
jgi:hypothetical protein